jgi:hypothetical protein
MRVENPLPLSSYTGITHYYACKYMHAGPKDYFVVVVVVVVVVNRGFVSSNGPKKCSIVMYGTKKCSIVMYGTKVFHGHV